MKIRTHTKFAPAEAAGSGGTIAASAVGTATAHAPGTSIFEGASSPRGARHFAEASSCSVLPKIIRRRVLRGAHVDTGF